MKEATGELSITVITIVAIAAIASIFVALILPNLRTQILLSQACSSGPGYTVKNEDDSTIECTNDANDAIGIRKWTCTYTPVKGKQQTKDCKD